MGVFDFVKNAGAKIGIGKSTDEEAAEEAAAAAAAAKAATAKRNAAIKERAAKRMAEQKAEAKVADAKEAALEEAKIKAEAAQKKAAAKERFAEYKKSGELEKYVSGLGIDMTGIDIRFDDGTAYITGETADQATKERIILSVGNAQGVGKVDEEITVEEPDEEAVFHVVQPGDTLWAIAQEVYGDGNRYPEIFDANKPMLSDPDMIFPGQVLRCPQ